MEWWAQHPPQEFSSFSCYAPLRTVTCSWQVGFATAYRLWRFPETARLRLSQVLVLPPFQRRNAGTQLMHAAYACAHQHGAADLTVSRLCQTASLCGGPAVAIQSASAGLPQESASDLIRRRWRPCGEQLMPAWTLHASNPQSP